MKVAKSYKIILLIVAFIMSTMLALGMMKSPSVYADASKVSATAYFNLTDGETVASASFEKVGLKIAPTNKSEVSFKNNLIVNDMSMKMKLPKGIATSINISLASFYVNGNPEKWSQWDSDTLSGTAFEKTIKNTLVLEYDENSKVVGTLNGVSIGEITFEADDFVIIHFGIEDNYLVVNDKNVSASYDADAKIYYKVKDVDSRAVSTKISIGFAGEGISASGGVDNSFILEYVDQMASDMTTDDYKQSFVLLEGQTKLTPAKKQRVYLSESFYLKKPDGTYTLTKKTNQIYSLSFGACSVIENSSTLCVVNPDGKYNVELETSTSVPNEILFNNGSDGTFAVGAKVNGNYEVFEEFKVNNLILVNHVDVLVENNKDSEAPKYVYKDNEIAYASFLNALKQEYTVEKENEETPEVGDKIITSAGLGTSLKIPSMKDLVFDNFYSYEELNAKVYYRNQIESINTQQMEFSLNKIGDYLFFVVFSDDDGNTMLEKNFIIEKNNVVENGIYGEDGSGVENYVGNFVFRFNIEDNADIIVKSPKVQGNGFKGVEYKASKFIIDAEGCRKTYKLFYNSNVNAQATDSNWIEIPQATSISEEEYKANGFSYEEVLNVNYDGELKFVPTRFGAYKIECTATSAVSSRYATSDTIIKVESEPNVVKVPSKWLENNVWSVVFLSVGTLSLIGIIVLLCIKPKEQTDND